VPLSSVKDNTLYLYSLLLFYLRCILSDGPPPVATLGYPCLLTLHRQKASLIKHLRAFIRGHYLNAPSYDVFFVVCNLGLVLNKYFWVEMTWPTYCARAAQVLYQQYRYQYKRIRIFDKRSRTCRLCTCRSLWKNYAVMMRCTQWFWPRNRRSSGFKMCLCRRLYAWGALYHTVSYDDSTHKFIAAYETSPIILPSLLLLRSRYRDFSQ
jgi:hypothetical protein